MELTAKKPDISVEIGKLKLKTPIICASGTFGYADEYEDFVNLQNIGAIVTKGLTLQPREGNPQPRIKEIKNGLINTIGLENIGINAFIEQKLPVLTQKNINFIANIAGFSIEEYCEIARICSVNDIKAVELNVSCPNVKTGCHEFGKDEKTLYELVSKVRNAYSGTLIVKLSPNVSEPLNLAIACQNAGADAISAINTVKGAYVALNEDKKNFSIIRGGLSGPVIKPVALEFIYQIRSAVKIPIIGMGGISNLQDVFEYFAVGSNAVQIGLANYANPAIGENLAIELQEFLLRNNYRCLNDFLRGLKNENNGRV